MTHVVDRDGCAESVCRRLEAELDDLVEQMWAAIVAGVEPYATLPEDHGDGRIREVAKVCLSALAGRPYRSVRAEARLRGVGAANADLGVPLGAMTAAIDAAALAGARRMRQEALSFDGSRASGHLVDVLWSRLFTAVRWFTEVMTAGWQERSEALAREAAYREHAWWGAVLDGHSDPPAMGGPALLLVVVACGRTPLHAGSGEGVHGLAESLGGALVAPERGRPIPHRVLVVPADDPSGMEALRDHAADRVASAGLAGVADVLFSMEKIGPTYRANLPILPALPLLARRRPGLVEASRLTLERLLTTVPPDAQERFLHGTLGPILAQPSERAEPLVATLTALAEPGASAKAVASRLDRHPRTIRHRLERVTELTGLDARDPAHRGLLMVAARLLTLRADTLPPPGAHRWRPQHDARSRQP